MRTTQLFFKTFKEPPADADVISQKLMEKGGLIRKLGKGLYAYTPLFLRVFKKLEALIRQEMERAGSQEVYLPLLHPAELWEESGRLHDYKAQNIIYTLKDREDGEYCLAPTHEEAITALVRNWVTSYKELPINLFQISDKFRDEIRPRFGLMRAKEFSMKDAYSFSKDEEQMNEQYEAMRKAYIRILERLGLDFAVVSADGGKIGKGKSEEFQIKASIGEDLIMICEDENKRCLFAANVEAAPAFATAYAYSKEHKKMEMIPTPGKKSVEEVSQFLKLPAEEIIKTLIYKLTFVDREEFVAVGIRGDRDINEVKVANHFGPLEIELASEEEVKRITGTSPGSIGPINLPIPFVGDLTLEPMMNFSCGANVDGNHYVHAQWDRDCPRPQFVDLMLARPGDICALYPDYTYSAFRGIEMGHIFNLGTRYSVDMNATFQDEMGETKPFWMGCYGIGVGRLAAACIEQKHDDKGPIWPRVIAPFTVFITPAVMKDSVQVEGAKSFYQECLKRGIEALFDDRDERIGGKLKDSDLWGIPMKAIFGKQFIAEGRIELENRAGEKRSVTVEELLTELTLESRP